MDEGGSWNGAFLSEEAQCGGPLGRAPSLGTLEDMLTHCGRVTQICVFNTVKLGTSASSP